MTPDEVLLRWAGGQFDTWALNEIDNFNRQGYRSHHRMLQVDTLAHFVGCSTRRLIGYPQHAWDCNCYSEVTRDDSWQVHVMITCSHDLFAQMRLEPSMSELPEILVDMAVIESDCRWDADDDE